MVKTETTGAFSVSTSKEKAPSRNKIKPTDISVLKELANGSPKNSEIAKRLHLKPSRVVFALYKVRRALNRDNAFGERDRTSLIEAAKGRFINEADIHLKHPLESRPSKLKILRFARDNGINTYSEIAKRMKLGQSTVRNSFTFTRQKNKQAGIYELLDLNDDQKTIEDAIKKAEELGLLKRS